MTVGIDGGYDVGVSRHLHRQRSTAMECLLGREHTGAAVVERRQFQGILVGFGTAVDEEQAVFLVPRDASQALGNLLLYLVDD